MQKICVTTLSLKRGGAERVVSNLCNSLCDSYEVHLIIFSSSIDYKIDPRVKIHSYNEGEKNLLRFFYKVWWFRDIIKKEGLKIIFSFLFRPNIISIIAKIGLSDVYLTVSERSNPTIYYKNRKLGFLNKALIAVFYPLSNLITVNSYGCFNELNKKFFIKREKLKIIRNPISVKGSSAQKNKNEFVCVTVGRLDQNKNQLMLINAYEAFLHEVRHVDGSSPIDFQFRIIGNGVDYSKLDRIIKERNLTSIVLLGEKDNIEEELKRSDLFIFGSKSEGFPNVLLEAMACNLPIISSDCKYGPGELLKDENYLAVSEGFRDSFEIVRSGILVDVDDYISMGKAMLHIFSNRNLIDAFISTYPEVLEKYRDDAILKKYKEILMYNV